MCKRTARECAERSCLLPALTRQAMANRYAKRFTVRGERQLSATARGGSRHGLPNQLVGFSGVLACRAASLHVFALATS